MMTRMRRARYIISLLITIIILQISEEKCRNYPKVSGRFCDSFQHLYEDNDLPEYVQIVKEKASVLDVLKPITSPNAKSIERLEIRASLYNITEGAFKNFINIKYLILSDNRMCEISPGIFKDLNVKYLALTHNEIETLGPGVFQNLTHLTDLRLSENNLTKIIKNVFNNLTIEALTLSNNQISEIEDLALADLPNLKKLRLDGNRLTQFSSQRALNSCNLEILWLHKNFIKEITSYMLECLSELKIINLGFNRIESIEPSSFSETPELSTLVLTHNHLKIIDGNVLPSIGLMKLRILYLDHNQLMFLSSRFFFRLPALNLMSISGNPWLCPCLDLVLKWLRDNKVRLNCDKPALSGEIPICVASDSQNWCAYSYNVKLSEHFLSRLKLYPPPSKCIL